MSAVVGAIVVTLAGAAGGLASLFFALPTWWPLWGLISVVLAGSVVKEIRAAEATMLEAANASLVDERDEPELHELVARVAAMLDVPKPELAVARSKVPNGFVVGKRSSKSIVVVSDDMRRRLTTEELEAVLAHELAHVAHRDSIVMTLASVPRVVGLELFASESPLHRLRQEAEGVGAPNGPPAPREASRAAG
jgi:heat shock protein HtpX